MIIEIKSQQEIKTINKLQLHIIDNSFNALLKTCSHSFTYVLKQSKIGINKKNQTLCISDVKSDLWN